jgi:acetyl esterase/lipase
MPFGYLTTVTIGGVLVLLGLVSTRRGVLPRMTYVPTMPVNEYPFIVVVWLGASTVLMIQEGYTATAGGMAGLVELIATLTALAIVFARSLRTGPVVSTALDRGLGADWHNELTDATLARSRARWTPSLRSIVVPWLVGTRRVRVVRNIRYGPDPRFNVLDLYHNRAAPPDGRVLVYFHGGGYHSGRKSREARALLYRLASEGWVCVSANYRLRPGAGFRDHLTDAKRVLAWTRELSAEGGSTSFVAGAGSSAGAHLVSICALSANDETLQPGFPGADTTLDAAICLYGYYGDYYAPGSRDRLASSPLAWDAAPAPPVFVAHGDHDTFTPVANARRFVSHLREGSGNPTVYAELPGAQHAFDVFRSVRFDAVVDGAVAFLDWAVERQGGGDSFAR